MDNSNTSNYNDQQPISNAINQPATGDVYQSQPMGTTATTITPSTLNQQQPQQSNYQQQYQPSNYQQQQASDINRNNANQQGPATNTYADQQNNYQPPIYDNNNLNQPMTDVKRPFLNDVKQTGDYAKTNVGSSKVPDYGANTTGPTPMQKEQEELRQQQASARTSGGYPGVVGGTPAAARGIQGYDAQGNPIIPQFIAQRHQIEGGLGPTCKDGGYHDLRMMLTGFSLMMAFCIIPYFCGYRGKRICTCKKCDKKFPNIVLPSAPPA